MNVFTYKPKGVCSSLITFSIEDGIVKNVVFKDSCSGNSQGISRLVEGLPVTEVIRLLKGIRCGKKETSCPDQFARALESQLDFTNNNFKNDNFI